MPKTKRVRCCCVMLPDGSYNIIGWGDDKHHAPHSGIVRKALSAFDGIDDTGTVTWIEADIEVPELPAERTVEGTVAQ